MICTKYNPIIPQNITKIIKIWDKLAVIYRLLVGLVLLWGGGGVGGASNALNIQSDNRELFEVRSTIGELRRHVQVWDNG